MRLRSGLAAFAICLCFAAAAAGQGFYSTQFGEFAPVDVNGQSGWGHLDNSPTGGAIELAPAGSPPWIAGSQALAVRTRNADFFGVSNHLYSAVVDPPAGESGSTLKTTPVPAPESLFQAYVWVMMPPTPVVLGRSDGRFAQINPASRVLAAGEAADRYAFVGIYNANGSPEVRLAWPTSAGGAYARTTVATLEWGSWYRFNYRIRFVDGMDGAAPNDRFSLTISSVDGVIVGSGFGSTWEAEWRTGGWGGGATPRAVNGLDLWSEAGPNGTLAFWLDDVVLVTSSPAVEPLAVSIVTSSSVCTHVATLVAERTGGEGATLAYEWRDGDDSIVGNNEVFYAYAGIYTVTVTDEFGNSATSAPYAVPGQLKATINGPASLQWDLTTVLTSSVTGGSGTIISWDWRNYSGVFLGSEPTLETGPGIYTVTVTDPICGPATSPSFQVEPEWTPDLYVAKHLETPGPYLEGESVEYTIFLMNRGGGPSSSATVTDTPTNMTITGVTGPCAAFPCTLPGLGPGQTVLLTVSAILGEPGPFENVATVSAPELDPDPSSNVASAGGMVVGIADLSIVKVLTEEERYFESLPARWRIVVRNDGPRPARSVEISNAWENLSLTSVAGACTALPCSIPSLGPGEETIIHVETNVVAPGAFGGIVSVSTIDLDPDPSNNAASAGAAAEPISAIPFSGPAVLFALGIALALVGAATVRAG